MNIKTHQLNQSHDRLDKALVAENLATSRSEAQRWIEEGRVRVGGILLKASQRVDANQKIEIDLPPVKSTELTPKNIPVNILFQDEHLLVVEKPAGLVVHPGAGNYDESLVHALLYLCKDSLSGIGGVERPGIVHRLDKGTTGLLVVAKNDRAHQNLTAQFQAHTVEKQYQALCLGRINKLEQTLVNLMKRSELNRKKFVVNQKKGKEAITHVKVLKQNDRVSHVSVKIDTGRTHQIRVHLNFIGHPILGDETYGGTKKLSGFDEAEKQYIRDLNRPLLHAFQLSFDHPVSKKRMHFESPLTDDFKAALETFFK